MRLLTRYAVNFDINSNLPVMGLFADVAVFTRRKRRSLLASGRTETLRARARPDCSARNHVVGENLQRRCRECHDNRALA